LVPWSFFGFLRDSVLEVCHRLPDVQGPISPPPTRILPLTSKATALSVLDPFWRDSPPPTFCSFRFVTRSMPSPPPSASGRMFPFFPGFLRFSLDPPCPPSFLTIREAPGPVTVFFHFLLPNFFNVSFQFRGGKDGPSSCGLSRPPPPYFPLTNNHVSHSWSVLFRIGGSLPPDCFWRKGFVFPSIPLRIHMVGFFPPPPLVQVFGSIFLGAPVSSFPSVI